MTLLEAITTDTYTECHAATRESLERAFEEIKEAGIKQINNPPPVPTWMARLLKDWTRIPLVLCLLILSGCIFGGGGRNTVDTVLFVEPGAYARIAEDRLILITATDATGKEHFEKKNLAGMAVEPESVHKKYLDFWEQGHPK